MLLVNSPQSFGLILNFKKYAQNFRIIKLRNMLGCTSLLHSTRFACQSLLLGPFHVLRPMAHATLFRSVNTTWCWSNSSSVAITEGIKKGSTAHCCKSNWQNVPRAEKLAELRSWKRGRNSQRILLLRPYSYCTMFRLLDQFWPPIVTVLLHWRRRSDC
jgi:hypothetical protein